MKCFFSFSLANHHELSTVLAQVAVKLLANYGTQNTLLVTIMTVFVFFIGMFVVCLFSYI